MIGKHVTKIGIYTTIDWTHVGVVNTICNRCVVFRICNR